MSKDLDAMEITDSEEPAARLNSDVWWSQEESVGASGRKWCIVAVAVAVCVAIVVVVAVVLRLVRKPPGVTDAVQWWYLSLEGNAFGSAGTDSAVKVRHRSHFPPVSAEFLAATAESDVLWPAWGHEEVRQAAVDIIQGIGNQPEDCKPRARAVAEAFEKVGSGAAECVSAIHEYIENCAQRLPDDNIDKCNNIGSLLNAAGYFEHAHSELGKNNAATNFFFQDICTRNTKMDAFRKLLDETAGKTEESSMTSFYRLAAQPIQHFFSDKSGLVSGVEILLRKTASQQTIAPYKDINAMMNRDREMYRNFVVANMGWWSSFCDELVGVGDITLGSVVGFFASNIQALDLKDEKFIEKVQAHGKDKRKSVGWSHVVLEIGEGDRIRPKEMLEAVGAFKSQTKVEVVFADGRPSKARPIWSEAGEIREHYVTTDKGLGDNRKVYSILDDVVGGKFKMFKFHIDVVRELVMDHPTLKRGDHDILVQALMIDKLKGGVSPRLRIFFGLWMNGGLLGGADYYGYEAFPAYMEVYQAVKILSANQIPTIFEVSLQRGFTDAEMKEFAVDESHEMRLGYRVFLVALLLLEKLDLAGGEAQLGTRFTEGMRLFAEAEPPFEGEELFRTHLDASNLYEAVQNSKLLLDIQGGVRGADAWYHPKHLMTEIAVDMLKKTGKYLDEKNELFSKIKHWRRKLELQLQ